MLAVAPNADAFFARGLGRRGLGDPASALSDFACCLALEPSRCAAHFQRGECFLDIGNPARAGVHFRAAFAAEQSSLRRAEAAVGLSQCYTLAGEDSKAEKFLDIAVEEGQSGGGSALAHFFRGRSLKARMRLAEAQDDFDAVIALDPVFHSRFAAVARREEARGRWKSAVNVYDALLHVSFLVGSYYSVTVSHRLRIAESHAVRSGLRRTVC